MAEPSTKILDPNGDLLIIVTATTGPFAPWDEPADAVQDEPSTPDTDGSEGTAPEVELRIKASSRHLGLASQRFGRMLQNSWPDVSVFHAEDGLRHWATETVDLEAFALVMDVIHGRNRSVPRSVDLEMLAKVAVVVDDLQCHEAFDIFADLWITKVKASSPPKYLPYSRDLVLWTFIAFVFYDVKVFESCTRIAIGSSTSPVPSLNLPIRGKILDVINSQRSEVIDKIIASLYDLVDDLGDGAEKCCYECDCMILGALIKNIRSKDVLHPRPSEPYAGLSVCSASSLIRNLTMPAWIHPNQHNGRLYGGNPLHSCDVKSDLDSKIRSLESEIKGLNLESDLGYTRGCV